MERNPYQYSRLLRNLHAKLDPRHFHWMGQTMAAVVGFVLDTSYCIPVIDQLIVAYDGTVIARLRGAVKSSTLGKYDDLLKRWKYLLSSAGLTKDERIAADSLFARKIGYPFDTLN